MAEYIQGFHSIEEAIRRGAGTATLLVSREGPRISQVRELAERKGVPVSEVGDSELTDLCGSPSHRGALLLIERPSASQRSSLKHHLSELDGNRNLVLVLDGVTDPQNLGAILRSADQFRVDLVVIPARRSAQENQTVSKVSSGASEYVPLAVVPNIPSALEQLKEKEFWIFGADAGGKSTTELKLNGNVCIVMGSEGAGMHRLVREKCDFLVSIPTAGHVDSFNVSVAAGILLFETRRQQGFPHLARR
ncbi:MAG TPA: 23S rRNA (guanosine(2251)-2'-O)-methyltransferase RlmB [Spirochaetia bacterium]|nr:23S rRNA (guanosine(2251)-2'-O)-methyltransferase RlmB [Spirochaetia bacterium]